MKMRVMHQVLAPRVQHCQEADLGNTQLNQAPAAATFAVNAALNEDGELFAAVAATRSSARSPSGCEHLSATETSLAATAAKSSPSSLRAALTANALPSGYARPSRRHRSQLRQGRSTQQSASASPTNTPTILTSTPCWFAPTPPCIRQSARAATAQSPPDASRKIHVAYRITRRRPLCTREHGPFARCSW